MIKTLIRIIAEEKEKFSVPRSVQKTIPIKRVYPDGIFYCGKKYVKSFRFSDINYRVASDSDKQSMFIGYCELLNTLDTSADTKITVSNRKINRKDFERDILLNSKNDGLNIYRKEYNDMLLEKALSGNGMTQEKYITVSVVKNNVEEARIFFNRAASELEARFKALSSNCSELSLIDRLMLVVLDSILNRITANRAKGRNTHIFIDEIYLLFQHEYSANFLSTLWKRVRKYGALATGITQNVDDLMQSHTARTMLANSEFIVMLNQAATDREKLSELLNISNHQLSYITDADAGSGLIKVGSSLVPFKDSFPRNALYKLMTTKFREVT